MKKIFSIAIISILLSSCAKKQEYLSYDGFIQGTTFHIVFQAQENSIKQKDVDSIFSLINSTFSTYDSTSIISKINRNETQEVNQLFVNMFNKSFEVYKKSNGAFDITVGQVVNAWGFGNTDTMNVDSSRIDSLMKYVGFDKVKLQNNQIIKSDKNIKIDFNAIAQGYTCDVIADFFESKNLKNYLIEVGGEIRGKGVNDKNEFWKVGIDKPTDNSSIENRELQEIVLLENKSIATSGNYRKFYEKDGMRISHTINPKTGFSANQNILSASVVANTCAEADAYATSFMVLGLEKSLEILKQNNDLEAYLISSDKNGKLVVTKTKGFEKMIFKQ